MLQTLKRVSILLIFSHDYIRQKYSNTFFSATDFTKSGKVGTGLMNLPHNLPVSIGRSRATATLDSESTLSDQNLFS